MHIYVANLAMTTASSLSPLARGCRDACRRSVRRVPALKGSVNIVAEGATCLEATSGPDMYLPCGRKHLCLSKLFVSRACGVSCTCKTARTSVFCGQPQAENW